MHITFQEKKKEKKARNKQFCKCGRPPYSADTPEPFGDMWKRRTEAIFPSLPKWSLRICGYFFSILLMQCAPLTTHSQSLIYTRNANPRACLTFFNNAYGRGCGCALSLSTEQRAYILRMDVFTYARPKQTARRDS